MKADRLARWIVLVFTLMIVVGIFSALISCSPANQDVTPPTQASSESLRPAAPPTRSPLPSPTATASVTPTPTFGAIALPTVPANGVSLSLTPDLDQTGWVSSDAKSIFTPDNNLNVGARQGQAYASIVQFDLTQFAPGTKLLFAALELSGRNANNLGASGHWTLDMLDTQTANWKNSNYDALKRAPVLFSIAGLPSTELAAGARKRFVFSTTQIDVLQKQIDRGFVSVRLSGPSDGDDNLFVWEASPGVREPTLHVIAVPASFTVITATPTPPDVFAAATQIAAQTLQARQIGTPTSLPRSLATATPLPYVVYTQVPTAVNRTEAAATAAYVTAVAFTTGTFTPVPLNWYTATLPPIAIPVGTLTPVPTTTPTIVPISPTDLAKRPLPAALYNKIAFLSGSRDNPTAWIIDPDGKNLAELTDRIYYDIAAARDVVSPDGTWLLYNAPDTSARQILQIWRMNIKDLTAPHEQITFHTRGISFAPVWSPDGSKILYTSTKDGREQEIFLFDFNNPHRWDRLSFSQEQYLWNQYPSWSPDGKQIVFSSDRGHIAAYTEIWMMNADGAGAKKLGDGSRDAWAPVWIKWTK